mgnify:CR=1 FL=1
MSAKAKNDRNQLKNNEIQTQNNANTAYNEFNNRQQEMAKTAYNENSAKMGDLWGLYGGLANKTAQGEIGRAHV